MTKANRLSGETATSIALSSDSPRPWGWLGAVSVPSTAPAAPASARATLITAAPDFSATSRYFPSGVTAAPATAADGSGMERTSVTAGAGPVPPPSRSTTTDPLAEDTANAHRPSGVAATPNGLAAWADDVLAEPSAAPVAVAPEQPGDASARAGSAGTGPELPDAAGRRRRRARPGSR